ncbi:MAG: hypothetical protein ACRD1G_01810 [Acidimicrobiales bacterium]
MLKEPYRLFGSRSELAGTVSVDREPGSFQSTLKIVDAGAGMSVLQR